VNRKSGDILKKIPLSGRPTTCYHQRRSRALVGIRSMRRGGCDRYCITKANESIPVNGSVHNVYVTPDGKYAVSGSIENKAATVIDLETEKAAMGGQVRSTRPADGFEAAADGIDRAAFSYSFLDLTAFAVVDFRQNARKWQESSCQTSRRFWHR